MAKTFNRAPFSVPTPSSSDVNNYFFNHYNWKGLNDDRNILAVDQETFQDCNNVYVDSEGLLRSRPALKVKTVTYKNGDKINILSDIINVWTFTDVTVYESTYEEKYYLTFINKTNDTELHSDLSDGDIRLLLHDKKILIFSKQTILYYDIDDGSELLEANDIIHTPVTRVISYDGTYEDVFNKNVLTSSELYTYLYSQKKGYSLKLLNKNVYIELDDVKYSFKFTSSSPYTFMKLHTALNDIGFENLGNDLRITSSESGDVFVSLVYDKNNEKAYLSFNNGYTFTEIGELYFHSNTGVELTLLDVSVSKDGYYLFALTTDAVYVKSIAKTGDTYKYPTWQPILQYTECAANKRTTERNNYFVRLASDEGIKFSIGDTVTAYDDTNYIVTQIRTVIGAPAVNDYTLDDARYNTCLLTHVNTEKTDFYNLNGLSAYAADNTSYIINSYISNFNIDCVPPNEHNSTPILAAYAMNVEPISISAAAVSDVTGISGIISRKGVYFDSWRRGVHYSKTHSARIFSSAVIIVGSTGDRIVITRHISSKSSYLTSGTSVNLTPTQYSYDASIVDETTVVTTKGILDITTGEYIPLLFELSDFYIISNNILGVANNKFYYNYFDDVLHITEKINFNSDKNKLSPLLFDSYTYLDNYYLSKNNKLYISAKTEDNSLYFPEISVQDFDTDIVNLHPISNTEVAIFLKDTVRYVALDTEIQAYRYYKSKLSVGCKKGSDIITTYDGKYTIFASDRGLVAMSYQDFVASSEQSLTYLSDIIYEHFSKYLTGPIKLFKFGFWLIIYKQDSKHGYVFDLRNNSWWPLEGINNITKFVNIDNEVMLLSNGKMYALNKSDIDYFDYDGINKIKISWFIKSQKLHLNALNNYKHIVNITFISVHDTEALKQADYNIEHLDFKLQVNNYRKQLDGNINSADEYVSVNYDVETVRTFVQRLNYSKVNEFQYMLSSDKGNAIEIPFSVNSITIKYKTGGQVR